MADINKLQTEQTEDYSVTNYLKTTSQTKLQKYHTNGGYQPYEPIMGYILEGTNKVARIDNSVNFI